MTAPTEDQLMQMKDRYQILTGIAPNVARAAPGVVRAMIERIPVERREGTEVGELWWNGVRVAWDQDVPPGIILFGYEEPS